MAAEVLALGDIGGTNVRFDLYDQQGNLLTDGLVNTFDNRPGDYEGVILELADGLSSMRAEIGSEIVVASFAVAGEVSPEGLVTKAGELHPWIGRNLEADIGAALGLPDGRAIGMNDTIAIALGQKDTNDRNGRPANGLGWTVSTGTNGARYPAGKGELVNGEEGHIALRGDAECPCGDHGHVESYVSGKGIELNHGMEAEEWLRVPENRNTLATDFSTAAVHAIQRHAAEGRPVDEISLTGGVAINHPDLFQHAGDLIRSELGDEAPAIQLADLGEKAGVWGTFVAARERLAA